MLGRVSTSTSRGSLRRIRRRADISQRELARAPESSNRRRPCRERAAPDLDGSRPGAGGRAGGPAAGPARRGRCTKSPPMTADAVRDMGNRRFPAHLDTRYGDDGWWHGPHRYDREQPWYTFDRDRRTRDRYRRRHGTPDDHQLPQAGDSPADRAAAPEARATGVPAPRSASSGSSPESFSRHRRRLHLHLPSRMRRTRRSVRSPVHAAGCPCSCRRRPEPLLPWGRARQPPAYEPRRGPLLGRPPRRGFRAYPAPLTAPSELSPARARGATP